MWVELVAPIAGNQARFLKHLAMDRTERISCFFAWCTYFHSIWSMLAVLIATVTQLPGDISMMKNLRSLAPKEETSIDVVEIKLTI